MIPTPDTIDALLGRAVAHAEAPPQECRYCKGEGIVYPPLGGRYSWQGVRPAVCICQFPWGRRGDTDGTGR